MARASLREQLVQAAVEQFHIHGYNGAGVKAITDAAGAPKGSFYNHFASKEELAVVAVERYGESRRLAELTDRMEDPMLRIRRHFEFLRDEHMGYGFSRGCLVAGIAVEFADHSESIRAAVDKGMKTWRAALALALTDARSAGLVTARTDTDIEALARFILNAWEGTLVSARAERSPRAYEAFFAMVFDVILR